MLNRSKINKNLKVSHYTNVFSYLDSLRIAYNALTGNLLALKGEEGKTIEAILKSGDTLLRKVPKQELLSKLGFLVASDVNELNVVREVRRMGRQRNGEAGLTILPTLDCNFGCFYCFEWCTKEVMSKEIQDALVRFTRIRLLQESKGLSIQWFGGEPLIAFPIIESLTLRLKNLCDERSISTPNASIVTNGYLLTPAMVARLINLGIESGQITLDGPPHIHNSRRPLKGGYGSFDKLLKNLKNIPEGFKVSIRINVDRENKDFIFDLLLLLFDEGIIPKAKPYIAKVEPFSKRCAPFQKKFMTSEEFAQFKMELRRRCLEAGIPWFSSDMPSLAAYRFCIVDQPKGFVVRPDGRLLKCWAESGNETPIRANLLQENTWNYVTLSNLQNRDLCDDEECCQCNILPICTGGCPQLRQNKREQGINFCPPIRYLLADEVRALYDQETPTAIKK